MSTVVINLDGTGHVTPDEPTEAEQVARDLLSLAGSKHEVRTNTDNGLMFVVPAALAEAYAGLTAEITTDVPEEPAAPKRRRARKET